MQGNTGTAHPNDISVVSAEQSGLSGKSNFAFVDWIRMISMVGIIWAHTPGFSGRDNYRMLDNVPAYLFLMDFFKFGVICFFMISGFLLAAKIHEEPPLQYFKRRFYATFVPYLVAFAGIVLLFAFKTYILHMAGDLNVGEYIADMFFNSALWFLPSYWLSLLVIISFRRFLDNKFFGLFLLAVTLGHTWYFAYSSDAQSHVHALFAFILYLWLGYYIARANLLKYFNKISVSSWIAAFVLLYIVCSIESVLMWRNGFREPLSILRISNQIYSVIAFLTMMCVFKKPLVSRWLDPRHETFGIYLYHMFPLAVLSFVLKFLSKSGVQIYSLETAVFFPLFVAKFIFVYVCTLLLVKLLLNFNLGFLYFKTKSLNHSKAG